jgi:hypothetical protein
LQGFQKMTARKAIRLGWINPPPMPVSSVPRPESQTVMLEPLAWAQLAQDRPEAAADGDT